MEPVSLASMAMGLLTAVVSKATEDGVKALGEFAHEKAMGMYDFLKDRWSGDREAKTTLELFEENPSRHCPALSDILVNKIESDADFANELAENLSGIGPRAEVEQKIQNLLGKATAIEIDNAVQGSIRAYQEVSSIDEGAELKGVVIKNFG